MTSLTELVNVELPLPGQIFPYSVLFLSHHKVEAMPGPPETSKMESFATILNPLSASVALI